MSEKEKNRENNQKKFDLQECIIDYAVILWITFAEVFNHPQGNLNVAEDNSSGKINPTFNKIVPIIAGDRRVDFNTF